jgi:hypothetical protein
MLVSGVTSTGVATTFTNVKEVGGLAKHHRIESEVTSEQLAVIPVAMRGDFFGRLPKSGKIAMVAVQLSNAANPSITISEAGGTATSDSATVALPVEISALSGWVPTYLQIEIAQTTTTNPDATAIVRNTVIDSGGNPLSVTAIANQSAGNAVLRLIDDGSAKTTTETLTDSDAATSEETAGTGFRINTNVNALASQGQYARMNSGDNRVAAYIQRTSGSTYTGLFNNGDVEKRSRLIGSWRASVPSTDAAVLGLLQSTHGSETLKEVFSIAIQEGVYYQIDGDADLQIALTSDISAQSIANVTLWIET